MLAKGQGGLLSSSGNVHGLWDKLGKSAVGRNLCFHQSSGYVRPHQGPG